MTCYNLNMIQTDLSPRGGSKHARKIPPADGTWRFVYRGAWSGSSPRWRAVAGTLLAVWTIITPPLVVGGLVQHGNPAWHFGERRTGTWLSGALLLASSVIAALLAYDTRAPGDRRLRIVWLTAAAAAFWLALDELLLIHERLDIWLHRGVLDPLWGLPTDHPVTDRIDDTIVVLYGVVAAAFLWRERRLLMRFPAMIACFTAAAALFAAMVALDIGPWRSVFGHRLAAWIATAEESIKLLAGVLIVCGLLAARDRTLALK